MSGGAWKKQGSKVSSTARPFPAQSTRSQNVSGEAWLQRTLPGQGGGSVNSSATPANLSRSSLNGLDLATPSKSVVVNKDAFSSSSTIIPLEKKGRAI